MAENLPRKLVAILYADVAGYSRMTGEDEDATHRQLRQSLDYIASLVASRDGRVMHYAGDAVLAKFDSVLQAVAAAREMQLTLAENNRLRPEEHPMEFRIGINLGDVIEDQGDIYGDGVNIAARLESLADPGRIPYPDYCR